MKAKAGEGFWAQLLSAAPGCCCCQPAPATSIAADVPHGLSAQARAGQGSHQAHLSWPPQLSALTEALRHATAIPTSRRCAGPFPALPRPFRRSSPTPDPPPPARGLRAPWTLGSRSIGVVEPKSHGPISLRHRCAPLSPSRAVAPPLRAQHRPGHPRAGLLAAHRPAVWEQPAAACRRAAGPGCLPGRRARMASARRRRGAGRNLARRSNRAGAADEHPARRRRGAPQRRQGLHRWEGVALPMLRPSTHCWAGLQLRARGTPRALLQVSCARTRWRRWKRCCGGRSTRGRCRTSPTWSLTSRSAPTARWAAAPRPPP